MFLAFPHWLQRAVGYEALLLATRRVMHRAVADALEERLGVDPTSLGDESLLGAVIGRSELCDAIGETAVELAGHWRAAGYARRSALFATIAAEGAHRTSRDVEALGLAREAGALLAAAGDVQGADAARIVAGRSLERLARYDEALAAYAEGQAADGGGQILAPVLAARQACGRAVVLHRLARYDEALAEGERALRSAQRAGSAAEIASARIAIGSVLWYQGRYDEALRMDEEALDDARTAGNLGGVATALNNLGIVFDTRGERELALARHLESLEIKRAAGDRAGVAVSVNNIALLRFADGRLEEALAGYEQALELSTGIGNRHFQAGVLANIAGVHQMRGEHELALRRNDEALAEFRALGVPAGEALCLNGLGASLYAANRLAEALVALDASVRLSERIGNQTYLCDSLALRGSVRTRLGDRSAARADAERALEMARSIGYLEGELEGLLSLALATGEAATALEAQRLAGSRRERAYECEAFLLAAEIHANAGERTLARSEANAAAELARALGGPVLLARAEAMLAVEKPEDRGH